MAVFDRSLAVSAAQSIIEKGGWCVVEACLDVPEQVWEARILIFDRLPEAVADAVAEEIDLDPGHDARLTGCDRRTLAPDPEMGARLCYLAS
ncbi:MAG TPA: hypothetical protein VGX45_07875 [Solirubrobacteraceae bacterium]|nr:hypothetical protein [Solirubrobacteraceae bacterium]